MLALGCNAITFNNFFDSAHSHVMKKDVDDYAELFEKFHNIENRAQILLINDLYSCSCEDICNANKTLLLTNSEIIKSATNINNIFDPDIISFPYYNLNKASKRTRSK